MNILVLNTSILAVDPQDDGDAWVTADQIIPKHVAAGAQLVAAQLPDGFTPTAFEWDGTAVVAKPVVLPPKTREELKAERDAAVAAIKVTTAAGNTFDGDETSQTRMARAILALQATGTPSVTWVLADNTVIQATAAELSEALALAGAAQAALWVIA